MKNIRLIGLGLVATAFLISATMTGRSEASTSVTNSASSSAAAPDWELKDVDGKTIHASDFKGKVVVLDFWATWCGPCRAEIPGFIALQKQYEAAGLKVIGVSVDSGGVEVVKEFMKKLGMNYPVVLADDKTVQAFGGLEGVPTTFIIDRAGHIVKKHLGYDDKDVFEQEIKALLSK